MANSSSFSAKARAAAIEYLAALRAYEAEGDRIDDDPPDSFWKPVDKASDRFVKACGFGFCADQEDVAQLVVRITE